MGRYVLQGLLIAMLCVVVLVISGVFLPIFFSKQLTQLRSEIDTQNEGPGFIKKLIPVSIAEDLKITSKVSTFDNVNNSTEMQYDEILPRTRPRMKRKAHKRGKRAADKNNLFAWNFNLNITRFENATFHISHEKNKEPESTQKDSNHLGMAVYVEGSGPNRTFKELQNSWSSVGNLIRNVFGVEIGNLNPQNDNSDLNRRPVEINGSIETEPAVDKIYKPNLVQLSDVTSTESPLNSKQRGARFFSFLGLGGRPSSTTESSSIDGAIEITESPISPVPVEIINALKENSTLISGGNVSNPIKSVKNISTNEEPRTEIDLSSKANFVTVVAKDSQQSSTDSDQNVFRNDNFQSSDALGTAFVTEKIKLHLDSDSLILTPHEVQEFTKPTEEKLKDIFSFGVENNITTEHDCKDCDTFNFLPENEVTNAPFQFTSSFSNEILEKFCMNLVNQLEDSERFLNNTLNSNNSNEDSKQSEEQSLTPSQKNEFFDLFSLLIALERNLSNSVPDVIEDSFFTNSDQPTSENTESVTRTRESRFFNFNMFGFGSGRSLNEPENLDFAEKFADASDLPSLLDCEGYFKGKRNITMFSKPNLLDIIGDPNIELTDFVNDTISSKLLQQQVQFLTGLLKANAKITPEEINTVSENINDTLSRNGDPSSKLSLDPPIEQVVSKSVTVTNIVESFNTDGMESEIDIDNKLTTKKVDSRFFNILGFGSGDSGTEATPEVQKSPRVHRSEFPEDGRIFGIFALGSGNGISETPSSEKDERIFPGVFGGFFGSGGGRQIDTSHIDTNKTDVDKLDLFQDGFSGDGREINSENLINQESTALTPEGRIFGLFGFGSGEGRDLTERDEIATTPISFIEDECDYDCSLEINNETDSFQNCSFDDCRKNKRNNSVDAESYKICDDCSDITNFTIDNTKNVSDGANNTLCNNCMEDNRIGDSFNNSFECDDCFDGTAMTDEFNDKVETNQTKEVKINKNQLDVNEHNTLCDDCYSDIGSIDHSQVINVSEAHSTESENSPTSINSVVTEDSHAQSTENEKSRLFLETKFLTGSGDGNLMEDNGGPINLIEEGIITSPPNVSLSDRALRNLDENTNEGKNKSVPGEKAILNVVPQVEYISTVPETTSGSSEILEKQKPKFPRRNRRLDDLDFETVYTNQSTIALGTVSPETVSLEINEVTALNNVTVKILNSLDIPRRRGRLEDSSVIKNTEKSTEDTTRDYAKIVSSTPSITFSFESSTVTRYNKVDLKSIKDSAPVFCIMASQCNAKLNERCVKTGFASVCGCRESFVRHNETGKCLATVKFETSMRFPEETFNEDLRNPESPAFIQKRKEAIETIRMLLNNVPELLPFPNEIYVTSFSQGSLIVDCSLILAAENETEAALFKYVENGLKKVVKNDTLVQNAALKMKDASVLAISSKLDPCNSTERNYCSENARCLRDSNALGGYLCQCKDGYFDAAREQLLAGEICEEICPKSYCGEKGHCEYQNGVRRCSCSEWYFGNRCEISGIVVVATFSANLGLIIIVVFLIIVCRGRCYKRSYGATKRIQQSEEVGTSGISHGRVTDVIAMEENVGAKVAKFTNISTPMEDIPVIKVTYPSFNESSISFGDSTFDQTPSVDSPPVYENVASLLAAAKTT